MVDAPNNASLTPITDDLNSRAQDIERTYIPNPAKSTSSLVPQALGKKTIKRRKNECVFDVWFSWDSFSYGYSKRNFKNYKINQNISRTLFRFYLLKIYIMTYNKFIRLLIF